MRIHGWGLLLAPLLLLAPIGPQVVDTDAADAETFAVEDRLKRAEHDIADLKTQVERLTSALGVAGRLATSAPPLGSVDEEPVRLHE